MFKTHTDGFVSQYTQDVYNVGIEQFRAFGIESTAASYRHVAREDVELGDYVLVSCIELNGEIVNDVFLCCVGSLFTCLETAERQDYLARTYGVCNYIYEVWQLCDDGELWQGWEQSCLSVEHDETIVVPYADREQGAWAYGLLRAKWHSGDVHGDCYALILKDGAVFARGDWQGYVLDDVDDAVSCFEQGLWDCLGYVDWHSCEVDPSTSLYVWESQIIDWLRLYGLEISWGDVKLIDERMARIGVTYKLVA